MTTISPSLLSADFLRLHEEILVFEKEKDLWFHLDIMDGHFVPNLTFGHPIIKQLSKVSQHPLDVHLMVNNPEFYIETFQKFNIHNFTFHYEVVAHHDRVLHMVKEHYPKVGMAFNPGTSLSVIPDYLYNLLDLILIMSVNPGFGGQSFIEGTLDKVSYLSKKKRELKANFIIQVDGGVDDKTAVLLKERGVDNLVAGSYIFKTKKASYNEAVKSLR